MEILSKIALFVALLIVVALLMALPVMWLWNGLMPEIFGLTEISFWQALGINILSSLLFKTSTSSKK